MSTLTERLTLGPLHNPVRGFLHGTAALAALAFGLHLWQRSEGAFPVRTTLLICALSQGLLYLTSSLYHSLPWPPISKRRMQRLDHAMIYVGIAGSITPIVWLGLDDWRREVILMLAWALAALGVSQKAFLPSIHERASIPFQILTACLGAHLALLVRFVSQVG